MTIAEASPDVSAQILSAVLPYVIAAVTAALSLAAVWFKAKMTELEKKQDEHTDKLKDHDTEITANARAITPPVASPSPVQPVVIQPPQNP